MKKVDDQLVEDLVEQLKNMDPILVRKMRAVTDEMKINPEIMEEEQIGNLPSSSNFVHY